MAVASPVMLSLARSALPLAGCILPLLIAAAGVLAGCTAQPPADRAAGSAGPGSGNVVVPVGDGTPADEGRNDAPPRRAAAPDETAYLGRWTGVEGMYLRVAHRPLPYDGNEAAKSPRSGNGAVSLTMMWDLDHRGTFDGTVTPDGIAFVREGRHELLRRTDGDATGLKYLTGKKDCLSVKPGEGYCRG